MTFEGVWSFLLFLDTFGKGWKVNKLYYKGWKARRLEGWKVGRLEGSRGFVISPVSRNFHRAERRRREARRV